MNGNLVIEKVITLFCVMHYFCLKDCSGNIAVNTLATSEISPLGIYLLKTY